MINCALLKKKFAQGNQVMLDGAMGTELQRRGVDTGLPLWSATALIQNPQEVKQIHADYIAAGANIITTNTFRTNVRVFAKANLIDRSRELSLKACELAHQARTESKKEDVAIAGCVAPLEDCYCPNLVPTDEELSIEHSKLIKYLHEGGVDFIFAETMNCIREADAVLAAAASIGLSVAISFVCDAKGLLLSGETIRSAVQAVEKYSPLFIATNCSKLDTIDTSLSALLSSASVPVGIYANGDGEPDDAEGWKFTGNVGIKNYLRSAQRWRERGAKLIGGCCGTTPDYIRAISETL